MELIYTRPKSLKNVPSGFCPGCSHALAQKIIAEVIDEMDIRTKAVMAAPVGCACLVSSLLNYDTYNSAHGRASETAAAMKSVNSDKLMIVYQGDGDAAAIGLGETIHVAGRGEPLTVFFANNGLYAMTGGQSAPTTRTGVKTSTDVNGYQYAPMQLCEMIASLEAPDYVVRCSLHDVKHVLSFKKTVKHAFERQILYGKYSFIEILGSCPTNTGVKTDDWAKFVEENVIPVFPIGEFKRDGKRLG